MSESFIIPINYIERKPDSQKYRIVGKGVTVEFLAQLIDDGDWPVERICENYGLTPSEVHAAWAFYYDHKDEIDQRVQIASKDFETQVDTTKRERLQQRLNGKSI